MQDEVLAYLKARTDITDVHSVVPTSASAGRAYELAACLSGRKVTLQLVIDEPLGVHEPRFFVMEPERLGLIPHVLKGGYVCYMHSEGLLLDQDNPIGVLEFCLDRALATLCDGISGRNQSDLFDEFATYWAELAKSFVVSLVEIAPEPKKILSLVDKNGTPIMVADGEGDLVEGFRRFMPYYPYQQVMKKWALYVPLTSAILPRLPKTLDELRSLVRDRMSESNWNSLRTIVAEMPVDASNPELLLISMPTPNGSRAIAGLVLRDFRQRRGQRLTESGHRHPFLEGGLNATIEAARVERCDYGHLMLRTSGETSLRDRSALVIGCGSVGSFIATELARAGITTLTLVDPDVLSVENIHRHVLGAKYLCVPKVKGLKAEIEAKCPFCHVVPIESRVEEFIEKPGIPAHTDLVIVALGKPAVELYLNRFFRNHEPSIPVVYTWVEPYGIGGHALLVNNTAPGCLECLFHDPLELSETLYNRASFADRGQYFGKTISGCGGAFTPYAGMDAVQTAILATRLGIDVLLGHETGNPLLSWKGRTEKFEERFRLSKRAKLTQSELFDHRYSYILERCPICAPKR